jgi:hypothetical protein
MHFWNSSVDLQIQHFRSQLIIFLPQRQGRMQNMANQKHNRLQA